MQVLALYVGNGHLWMKDTCSQGHDSLYNNHLLPIDGMHSLFSVLFSKC